MKVVTKDDITFQPPTIDKYVPSGAWVCAPIAVSLALGVSFDTAYMQLAKTGMRYGILMNSNRIISKVLESKFNRYRGKFQLTESEKPLSYATLKDVVINIYNSNQVGDAGYLVSTTSGRQYAHIQYVKGLTVYDGCTNMLGEFRLPKDKEVMDSWLDDTVTDIWLPKLPNEPIYCDPMIEFFREVLIYKKVYGLFGKFHIYKKRLPSTFECYDVESDENGKPKRIVTNASNNRIGCLLVRNGSFSDRDELEISPQKGDWELLGESTLRTFRHNHKNN